MHACIVQGHRKVCKSNIPISYIHEFLPCVIMKMKCHSLFLRLTAIVGVTSILCLAKRTVFAQWDQKISGFKFSGLALSGHCLGIVGASSGHCQGIFGAFSGHEKCKIYLSACQYIHDDAFCKIWFSIVEALSGH